MIGVYDFCGHYEWTFEWLRQKGGQTLVREYWDQSIHQDFQTHAAALILEKGIQGMKEYWGHTLESEGAGFHTTATKKVLRIDMHDCPSKGFLLRNRLDQYHDYCDHCMGWIGPLLKRAGFAIDHQHNHQGQCWWEMRAPSDPTAPSQPGELSGQKDVRLRPDWNSSGQQTDTFLRANDPNAKTSSI